MTEYTDHYGLVKPAFNYSTWHDAVNDNMDRIDTLLSLAALGINIDATWDNSVAFEIGDRVYVATTNRVYECLVAHTSAVTGTFTTDWTANPSYWGLLDVGTVWRGLWVTATAYRVGDTAYNGGSTYRAKVDHTSGNFAADLAAVKWELYASQGGAGAGTGDVVGPAGATDQAIALFDGVTGLLLKDSTVLLSVLALLNSPTFTGTPTAPTAANATSTTQIATTAFVKAVIADLVASSPTTLDTLNEIATALGNDPNFAATMTTLLAAKAPLASPVFTGNPTGPTAAPGDNDTSIATTAFVQAAIASVIATTTSQPVADVAASSSMATTGLNIYKTVLYRAFVEISNVTTTGTRPITISARVSGGTKRTIASITTPSIGNTANMLFSVELDIFGMNQSQEKVVMLSYNFSADATTLDSSNAVNTSDTTKVTGRHLLLTWDEIWDEISIDLGTLLIIEGSTTDERGRVYIVGSN